MSGSLCQLICNSGEIAQLFMCIATFIYKHEILRQKVAETSFCNSVGVKTTAMA